MKVLVAESLGMCFGVRDALEAARAIERPTQVTVFGQLVHNPVVTRELADSGFVLADEASRGPAAVRTQQVLITAHGVSDRERGELLALGKQLVDTTCPLVRRAHAAALRLHRAGYFVVVIGRRGHVEVRGLTGDLDRFDIVESERDVRRYDAAKIGIVAQTTTLQPEANALVERIGAANPQAEVRFVNTICQPTRDRQTALEELLGKVDVLVVVGGRQSNNTRQLVARAEARRVRAVHVEDAGELREELFGVREVAGLTAGTSTLPETIAAVRTKLEGFHKSRNLFCRTDVPRVESAEWRRPFSRGAA